MAGKSVACCIQQSCSNGLLLTASAAAFLCYSTGNLERGLVSCTGSQFCGFGLIETKQRAMQIVAQLEASMQLPNPVRIHWTGCPNSCGQAQVADIGLMGGPAKLNGKAVEGVKIFLGGKVWNERQGLNGHHR